MRHLPTTTRLAIAKVYLRYRDAREQLSEVRDIYGSGDKRTAAASEAASAIWNTLQSILDDVANEFAEIRRPVNPKEMLTVALLMSQHRARPEERRTRLRMVAGI